MGLADAELLIHASLDGGIVGSEPASASLKNAAVVTVPSRVAGYIPRGGLFASPT